MILPYPESTSKPYIVLLLIFICSTTSYNTNRIIPENQYSSDRVGVIDTAGATSNYSDAVIDNVYVNESVKYNHNTSRDEPSRSTTLFLNSIANTSSTYYTSFKVSISKPVHVHLNHTICNKSINNSGLVSSLFLHIKTVVLIV